MKTKTYSAAAGGEKRILERLSNMLRSRSNILFAYACGSFIGNLYFMTSTWRFTFLVHI